MTGIYATKSDGSYMKINVTKGVIICTGGYGANNEMLEALQPGVTDWCVTGSATCEKGQGIKMALWAGGQLEAGGGSMIWNRGGMTDDTTFGKPYNGELFIMGSQPYLHVNTCGERFMNEDQCYPMSYAMACNQPGHYSWGGVRRQVLRGRRALRHLRLLAHRAGAVGDRVQRRCVQP